MSNLPKHDLTQCRSRKLDAIRAGQSPVLTPSQLRWFQRHGHVVVLGKDQRTWTLRLSDGAVGQARSITPVQGSLRASDPEPTVRRGRARRAR